MSTAASPDSALPIEASGPTAAVVRTLRADTLADGVMLLLALTVVQKLIGFVRGVLFCRWLAPEDLGTWDLTYSFLCLAAPLTVLGLPGSFGRYTEHFRQRGQLRAFLIRTIVACSALAALGVAAVALFRQQFSWILFDTGEQASLVAALALALGAAVAYNFLIELFNSLRQMRIVSLMQFTNSLLFALFGMALVTLWRTDARSIVLAFAGASAVSAVGASLVLALLWRTTLPVIDSQPATGVWSKLLPFAAWVWISNMLINLFEMSDRYMIVHLGPFSAEQAKIMVGNYHSSRVVPILMVAVAGMFTSMVVPHLSHDWETGRRRRVARRLNLIMKCVTLLLMLVAVVMLLTAPLLFEWAFGGKYNGGRLVFPWTLACCLWYSLGLVLQSYLWCAERTQLTSLVYLAGLLVNIGLNLVLLPVLGLQGAIMATAAANAFALAGILLFNRYCGMQIDRSLYWLMAMPVLLPAGAGVSLAALCLVGLLAWRNDIVFRPRERRQLAEAARRTLAPLGRRFSLSPWPT